MNEEIEDAALSEIRHLRWMGECETALNKLVMLHDSILRHTPSEAESCGYATLSEWMDFAKCYIPARDKLGELRAAKINLVLDGIYDENNFVDLERINRSLNDVHATVDLFKMVEVMSPEAAKKLSRIAIDSLVDLREYERASNYMLSPGAEYGRLKQKLEEWRLDLEEQSLSQTLSQEDLADTAAVFEGVFIEGVHRLIAVLTHTNESEAVLEIQRDAEFLVGHRAFAMKSRGGGP